MIASNMDVNTILLFIAVLLGFALVHVIKMMRMYLVVMEQSVPFKRFVPAYLRTTLVNLIIPFKLGEIYRIGVFSRITGSFNVGFFSVLVDRFFDTLALVAIILPYQILSGKGVSVPVILLTVFLLLVVFAYLMFPSSYKYLNRYIIMNRVSKSSMAALRGLEKVHDWYLYVRALVTGRYGLMVLFSFAAWIFEMLVLVGIGRFFGIDFSVSAFGEYISSILSPVAMPIERVYTVCSIVIIAIATIVFTVIYLVSKKKEHN